MGWTKSSQLIESGDASCGVLIADARKGFASGSTKPRPWNKEAKTITSRPHIFLQYLEGAERTSSALALASVIEHGARRFETRLTQNMRENSSVWLRRSAPGY